MNKKNTDKKPAVQKKKMANKKSQKSVSVKESR